MTPAKIAELAYDLCVKEAQAWEESPGGKSLTVTLERARDRVLRNVRSIALNPNQPEPHAKPRLVPAAED